MQIAHTFHLRLVVEKFSSLWMVGAISGAWLFYLLAKVFCFSSCEVCVCVLKTEMFIHVHTHRHTPVHLAQEEKWNGNCDKEQKEGEEAVRKLWV